MAIEAERRARLSARVTALSKEQSQALKQSVSEACGHTYSVLQKHAWGLCDCGDGSACPEWVETGFAAAEALVADSARLKLPPSDSPFAPIDDAAQARSADRKLDDVFDETAMQMTGLLRGVVVDEDEIKSSKAAEGGVFEDSKKEEED